MYARNLVRSAYPRWYLYTSYGVPSAGLTFQLIYFYRAHPARQSIFPIRSRRYILGSTRVCVSCVRGRGVGEVGRRGGGIRKKKRKVFAAKNALCLAARKSALARTMSRRGLLFGRLTDGGRNSIWLSRNDTKLVSIRILYIYIIILHVFKTTYALAVYKSVLYTCRAGADTTRDDATGRFWNWRVGGGITCYV